MTLKRIHAEDLVTNKKKDLGPHYAAQYASCLMFMNLMRYAQGNEVLKDVVVESAVQMGYMLTDMMDGDEGERDAAAADARQMADGLFRTYGAMR